MSGGRNSGFGATGSRLDGRNKGGNAFEVGTLIFTCESKKTEQPITWWKNDKKIPDHENQQQLNLRDVTFDDTDKYFCIYGDVKIECSVRAKKLPVEYSTPLKSVQNVKEGDKLTLTCEYKIPHESAQWFIKDGQQDNRIKLSAGESIQLEIKDITNNDTGKYLCNYKGVEITIQLKVEGENKEEKKKGKLTCFKCEIKTQDSHPVKWLKNGETIAADKRFSFLDNKGKHQLSITNLRMDDAGEYSCNCWDGVSQSTCTVTVLAKPDPPADLEVEKVSKGSVALKWNAGLDGGLPQQFKVGYKASGGRQNFKFVDVQPPGSTYSTVNHLAPGAEYEFIVIAFNNVGESADSKMIKAKTPTKPDQPVDLQEVNVSKDSVSLKWNAGLDGGLPQHFRVGYKAAGGRPNFKFRDVQPQGSTSFKVDGLAPGTEYEFIVVASNDVGESAESNKIKIKTPTKPDPPTGLQVVNVSQDSAILKWNAGWDGGFPQTFNIGYNPTANKREYKHLDVHLPPDNTTYTVEGLVPGTEYEFTMTARNKIGVSETSDTIKAKTQSALLNWIKSPVGMIVCSVVLSLVLRYGIDMIVGNSSPLPLQIKDLSLLKKGLGDIELTVSTIQRQNSVDYTSFLDMLKNFKSEILKKDEEKFKDISDKIKKLANKVSDKAESEDLQNATETFDKKVMELKENFETRINDMRRAFTEKLANLTKFIDEFEQTFSNYEQSFNELETKTNEKTKAIEKSLDSLSSKVEEEITEILDEVTTQLDKIKKAKEEADNIVNGIQRNVERIIPNTFNKEALIMAFMVLIISVFVLALWIYKVQNSITSGGPAPNRDMNAKDVLQRIPHRVSLSNSICIVSFDEARQPAHEALVSSAFLTVGNIQTKYFVVRRHEHLLNMPKCKFYIMCTEFSERHVIIEEPGLGLGDLKRCTYETIQRYGAKMIILYTRDPGSRNLGDQVYNRKIHCVSAQPELSCLRDHGRFFSTYDELSATQKKALNDTVVKCLQ
ncbi:receptor-type tyrosine-protein phosphatase F-like [Mercenaria mercenaria]|uniref:receptor-type tyrosine-protein phosphatase F-like n=1 Tax=Mercenaria mercenaria TaxID=6596 RepID=UPI00234F4989|nr:receptor-type tyrosine-protein phosphatase F-like [Mercenaria mercenaria]